MTRDWSDIAYVALFWFVIIGGTCGIVYGLYLFDRSSSDAYEACMRQRCPNTFYPVMNRGICYCAQPAGAKP